MSEWVDGYIAAALHDLKKALLSNKGGNHFGTWGPGGSHADLSDLSTQLDSAQQQSFEAALGTTPPSLELENDAQVDLIRVHHKGPRGLPPGSSADLQRAALALEFADRAHKALYFSAEGSGQIEGVNWRCPWYYPFWGEKKPWTVPEAQQRFLEAAQRIRQHLDSGGHLEAEFLVRLGEDLLSDFGDSTFLPVTSLHFHHQLSAAIYLMVMKELEELGHVPLGTDRNGGEKAAVSLHLTRSVITLPPERLRYRLRDAMHLRKISQRLLIRLHQHLSQQYLPRNVMGAVRVTHPAQSPLVFYGKEAIVILSREADDKAIMQIAREVADETETPIKIERQPLELSDHSLTATGATLPFDQLTARRIGLGVVTANAPEAQTEWAMPKLAAPDDAAHECAACHKPIARGEQRRDLDDDLCQTCYRIRREYRECPECSALFPPADRCPLCGNDAPRAPVGAGRLIRLLDHLGGERVAIIAVRIGAMPEAMEIESELRLAQFREERLAAEQRVLSSCGRSGTELQRDLEKAQALTPLVHGTGGELEYLQAVLEIGRKQDEWQQWLADELYLGKTAEAAAHFVYRSPAVTVLLVSESFLRTGYRRITGDLESIHIAHRLDIVTCDTHYPIYDALSSLFTRPGKTLEHAQRPREAVDAAEDFRQLVTPVYEAWWTNRSAPPPPNPPLALAHRRVLAAAQAPAGTGLSYRVVRGGQERVFVGEQARQLLDAEPSRQSAAQLHAVALLAEQLASVSPAGDEGTRETLLMDLDGRARYIAEDMMPLVKSILIAQRPAEAAQHLRELARAIRPT